MRKIINISLPQSLYDFVDKQIKKGKFASKSEYFRHLIRLQTDSLVQKEILESYRAMKKGNKYELKSFKDLR